MLDWIHAHLALLCWTFGASAVMLVGAAVALVRIPADYFTEGSSKRAARKQGAALVVVRNILGGALIIAGLAMIVLPGPGVLVIILGLTLTDLPGKKRAEAWLLSRGAVVRPVNALRRAFGRDPLEFAGGHGAGRGTGEKKGRGGRVGVAG